MRSHYEQSLVDFNWRDEIKKLGILLDKDEFFAVTKHLVLEKLALILAEKPITLALEDDQAKFNRWKVGPARIQ